MMIDAARYRDDERVEPEPAATGCCTASATRVGGADARRPLYDLRPAQGQPDLRSPGSPSRELFGARRS